MATLTESGLFPSTLSDEIRSRFDFVDADPLSGDRIWLESASGSLRLKAMVEALAERSRWPDNYGRANPASAAAGAVVAQGIQDVRTFLGATSGEIMPALSSTHAIFRVVHAVLASLADTPNTNVITTNLEHPAVYDATAKFAAEYGQERRVATVDPSTGFVPPEAVLDLVDEHTGLIAMMHASNVTGALLDVGAIAREAKRINPNVLVAIDGVQYAPHAPVDVAALGVDAYIFGPYKAFCVKGIGFAYLSDRLAALDHWNLLGKPNQDWTLGSPEDGTYAAWSAVTDYLCWLGTQFTDAADRRAQLTAAMQASETHISALLHRAINGANGNPGLRAMSHVRLHGVGEDLAHRTCLVLFNLDGLDSYQGVEIYRRAGVRLHNRVRDVYTKHVLEGLDVHDGIRMAACHYNTADEIDRFLQVTADVANLTPDELAAVPQAGAAPGQSEG